MNLEDILKIGTRAAQPLASSVAEGTLYSINDEGYKVEQSRGGAWVTFSGSGGSSFSSGGGLPLPFFTESADEYIEPVIIIPTPKQIREILAGSNITFDDTVPGVRTINGAGGGGGSSFPIPQYWFQVGVISSTGSLLSTNCEAAGFYGGSGAVFTDNIYGYGNDRYTGLSAGDQEGVQSGANNKVQGIHDYTVEFIIRTPAAVTNCRFWVGLFNDAAPGGSGDTMDSSSGVAFRFSTSVPDSGWVGVSKVGGTQSITAQVGTCLANTTYKLTIRKDGSTVYFSVNDGTEVSKATDLPASSTALRWAMICVNVTGSQVYLGFLRMWMKSALAP